MGKWGAESAGSSCAGSQCPFWDKLSVGNTAQAVLWTLMTTKCLLCPPMCGNLLLADVSLFCWPQSAEKKPEVSVPEAEPSPDLHTESVESLTRVPTAGPEGAGGRTEQPFIVLGQEEYGEHHSSIMHCRWAGLGCGRQMCT